MTEALPWWQTYLYTYVASLALYMMHRLQKKQPFSLFTAINVPIDGSTKPLVVLGDMIVSCIIGAFIVVPLTNPATVPQAIIAGLGTTGILAAHTKDVG
jgi:hypothetical protein